jgi:hypothetical protein
LMRLPWALRQPWGWKCEYILPTSGGVLVGFVAGESCFRKQVRAKDLREANRIRLRVECAGVKHER